MSLFFFREEPVSETRLAFLSLSKRYNQYTEER